MKLPIVLRDSLIEMMEPIRAQEDAEMAQVLGLFTAQASSKHDAQRLSRARQKYFRRKSRQARQALVIPAIKKAEEERPKIDLSIMTKEEKRNYLQWLKEHGISG